MPRLVLIRPQIPQNAGNVGRTCVASGTPLHLVGPMGFVLDDRRVKRAGLDYWPRLDLTLHVDEGAFWRARREAGGAAWLFDSAGEVDLFDDAFCAAVSADDWLVMGSETRGLSPQTLAAHAGRTVRLPQVPGERCLNLATSAGIALYWTLGQLARRTPPSRDSR